MGTPLLAGRDFGQLDTPESPVSVIVNEAFARKFLGGASPLGATLRFGPASKARNLGRIVGLVAATKYNDLREDFPPIIYLARSQEKDRGEYAHVLMRCAVPPGAVQSAVKLALAGINPDIGFGFHVLRIQIQESLLRERLMATLSAFFAALAGALTAIGLYGVISYMVSRRTNEIGIRMALGAGRAGIMRMILRESAILLAVGLALGAALSLATERAASTLLFGLRPHDPTSLALAAGGLAAVTLIASYLPARRAAGLDPMSALREE
jgi:putative ABC transport system permease protein